MVLLLHWQMWCSWSPENLKYYLFHLPNIKVNNFASSLNRFSTILSVNKNQIKLYSVWEIQLKTYAIIIFETICCSQWGIAIIQWSVWPNIEKKMCSWSEMVFNLNKYPTAIVCKNKKTKFQIQNLLFKNSKRESRKISGLWTYEKT